MGLNLTLVIENTAYAGCEDVVLGYDRLTVATQNRELFDRIEREAIPLEQQLYEYNDEGLRKTGTTPYGRPLTWLPAKALAAELSAISLGARDRAVLMFLQSLPADTRIVLWWC